MGISVNKGLEGTTSPTSDSLFGYPDVFLHCPTVAWRLKVQACGGRLSENIWVREEKYSEVHNPITESNLLLSGEFVFLNISSPHHYAQSGSL